MFQRQWFPSGFQSGITKSALILNQAIRSNDFAKAFHHIGDNNSGLPLEYRKRQFKRTKFILTSKTETVRVFWDDFWPDFDKYHNQFIDFMRKSCPYKKIVTTSNPLDAHISFYSCYGNLKSLQFTDHTTRLLFLGENVRPNFLYFDHVFSFDLNTYRGNNTYMPLWFLHLNIEGQSYPDRNMYDISLFTQPSRVDLSQKENSIVYIGNNNEPSRMALLNALSDVGHKIKIYGSQSRPISSKEDIYSKYRFILSPENSFSEGYVTEKMIDSYASGSYFLYWGGFQNTKLQNVDNMIYMNLALEPNINAISNDILSRPLCYEKQPLFTKDYIDELLNKILESFYSVLSIY